MSGLGREGEADQGCRSEGCGKSAAGAAQGGAACPGYKVYALRSTAQRQRLGGREAEVSVAWSLFRYRYRRHRRFSRYLLLKFYVVFHIQHGMLFCLDFCYGYNNFVTILHQVC